MTDLDGLVAGLVLNQPGDEDPSYQGPMNPANPEAGRAIPRANGLNSPTDELSVLVTVIIPVAASTPR